MFKSLNRGISAPIAIVIIVVCALLVGGIVVWQYYGIPKEEKEAPEEKVSKEVEVEDCGVSESLISYNPLSPPAKDYFENDSVLVCLTKNIVNNCKNSKAIVKTGESPLTVKVTGTSSSDCKLRMEYPDESKIFVEEQKQYANLYIECPISKIVSFMQVVWTEKEIEETEKWISESPGEYAAGLYLNMGFVLMMGPEATEKELSCEGTLLEAMRK